jgi:hypothetical protein
MSAPVYRQLGKLNVFLGLVFPQEFLPIFMLLFAALMLDMPNVGLALAAGLHLLLVLSKIGRPQGYWVARLLRSLRRLAHGKRFSSAARGSKQTHARLHFAPYSYRD